MTTQGSCFPVMILHSSSTFSPQPTKDFFFFSFLKQQLPGFSRNGSRCSFPPAPWQGFTGTGCAFPKWHGQILQWNQAPGETLLRKASKKPHHHNFPNWNGDCQKSAHLQATPWGWSSLWTPGTPRSCPAALALQGHISPTTVS